MPVAWQFRGTVLTLTIQGVATTPEIEQAIDAALANAPSSSGMRLLWDARASEGPLSSDDLAGRIELVASLGERRALEFGLFTDEAEARAWLEQGQ